MRACARAVGGNHEAPNYLWELYHGGWAAPNIFFLGCAAARRAARARSLCMLGPAAANARMRVAANPRPAAARSYAGAVCFGGLRIAGLSGIFNAAHYKCGAGARALRGPALCAPGRAATAARARARPGRRHARRRAAAARAAAQDGPLGGAAVQRRRGAQRIPRARAGGVPPHAGARWGRWGRRRGPGHCRGRVA